MQSYANIGFFGRDIFETFIMTSHAMVKFAKILVYMQQKKESVCVSTNFKRALISVARWKVTFGTHVHNTVIVHVSLLSSQHKYARKKIVP